MKVKLSQITDKVNVRSIKAKGVEQLKKKIEEVGYLPEKPVLLAPNGTGDTYTLIDGNHRVKALEELDKTEVDALVDESLKTEALQLRRARLANEVAETLVPTTFVDDAELVWSLSEKMTQTEIGSVLGWSRSQVNNYKALSAIDTEVWKIVSNHVTDTVSQDDTFVSIFSEGLLRSILLLNPSQQFELVNDLAKGSINKTQFNKRAAAYKTRNEIWEHVLSKLPEVNREFVELRITEIDSGGFDDDWQTPDKPKITKLIESVRAEWEQKSGTQLIFGDFEAEVLSIEDGIVDLVCTDIPYNISDQGKVTKRGSEIVNASFGDGDWDAMPAGEYLEQLRGWIIQWERVLRTGGAAVSFCDKVLVSDLWRFFIEADMVPKGIIIWKKDNPNPSSLSRRNLISSVEFMVWAVKPGASYTFNESQTWNRSNVIEAPLCGGNERIKDERGDTLHPTQKPIKVLEPIIEVFSNRGDLVFDGFAGVGSAGEVATNAGRKFIGIENHEKYFRAMQRRLA